MIPNNYTLRYKSFDSLLADIKGDFKGYDLENMIEPQELIRVAKWCNRDLGLRIYKTKEILLELHNGRVKLPEDFFVFNYGLLCGDKSIRVIMPQGTNIQEIPYPRYQSYTSDSNNCANPIVNCHNPSPDNIGCGSCDPCKETLTLIPGYNPLQPYGNPCIKPRVFMNCKGDNFELIQVVNSQVRHWKYMLPLRLVNANDQISCNCPNIYSNAPDHIWIKDNFLYSNLKHGSVYISYEGMMEDEEGNLLVLDHDLINPFYEYKLKERILENLYMNDESVENKLKYIQVQLRKARIEAKTIANMPNFQEIHSMWQLNRKAYNIRFVDMFRARSWILPHYNGTRIWK